MTTTTEVVKVKEVKTRGQIEATCSLCRWRMFAPIGQRHVVEVNAARHAEHIHG
jgi:hypothetical protein